MSSNRKNVLFLCTGNSCRSQMAESWAKNLHAELIEAYSAGTNPLPVNPLAVKVMAEVGINLSNHESKHFDSLSHLHFDLIVTVCDNAANNCPIPPHGTRVIHAPFADPPQLARHATSESEALPHYRKVRDEIKDFVTTLPTLLESKTMREVKLL